MTGAIFALALALAAPVAVAGEAPTQTEDGVVVARDTVLFRGGFAAGHQPDGNSTMIAAPAGWIVFDTGRHRAHVRRLLDHARASGHPVATIINSHWHLDHASGNRILRDAFPEAPVLASGGAEAALAGFLADSRRQSASLVAQGRIAEPMLSDVRGDMATIDDGAALLPTEVVERSGPRTIAGRAMHVGLAAHAVSEGDVWLFDPATRVLLAGDLVTLPAPLFDTACPQRWREALATLDAMDFAVLVPGHGAPMDHAGFARYRRGFDRLLACAASDADADACARGWLDDAGALVPRDEHALAGSLLAYYVPNVLRAPAARPRNACPADAR
ncbi:MAG TPA: MBL fold metallo-hydrolase [Luteimonas sp.]|nr:MBL fold metallo-hydrolase [Luteimonas sp.]